MSWPSPTPHFLVTVLQLLWLLAGPQICLFTVLSASVLSVLSNARISFLIAFTAQISAIRNAPLDNHLQKNIILQHLILLYTCPKWPYLHFHFLWYQGPEVKNSLNILRKEFYNKVIHKTSILLPCGAIKSLMMYTLHHFQRANHSFTQCIHAEYTTQWWTSLQAIRSTVVDLGLCSMNPYFI